jgi:hypothetical protein
MAGGQVNRYVLISFQALSLSHSRGGRSFQPEELSSRVINRIDRFLPALIFSSDLEKY